MSIISPSLPLRAVWAQRLRQHFSPLSRAALLPSERPCLTQLASLKPQALPGWARQSAVAMRYIRLLGVLDWEQFPQRLADRPWPGPAPRSPVPYLAAFLVRLDQGHASMAQLRRYLVEHPALAWALGFPLVASDQFAWGFDVDASLPASPRFSRILRALPNDWLQFLLDSSVQRIRETLPASLAFGWEVALDTKHILAWVKENNPKAFIEEGRFDKTRQPAGDRDCKLGCKRKRNRAPEEAPATPAKEGQPARGVNTGIGEFYWGYASGVVATRVPGWGEFILAEMTQTFDCSDASYFFPLMEATERRLGFRPPFGTADAAYDAFYVYAYFHEAGGFAAVPLAAKGGRTQRAFDEQGLPLCEAGLAMPLKLTFTNRTSLVVHQRGRYACPLLFPEPTSESCPIAHKNWSKGGCTTTLATSIGARLRYHLDRESDAYKALYKQRTLVERIFSQAMALGIERPKLRNRCSIANLNTLLYVLLNLRALQRISHKQALSCQH
jgi:hypothetical protein